MKYVFNITLKLNNHTWKKLQNYFLMEKNEPQIIGFIVARKAPSLWKKMFEKKILPAYLCGCDLQKAVRKWILNKWFSRYLNVGVFHKILLIKLDRQKIKKIPHIVLETIISRIIA